MKFVPCLLTFIVVFSLLPDVVIAKTLRQRANVFFLDGRKLYSKGKYTEALTQFNKANRLFPSYKIDVSIGFCLDVLQRAPEAAEFFERFLLHPQSNENPSLLNRVQDRLKKIRSILGTVTLSSKTDGAIIAVDGKPVGKTPLKHRIYLPPGTYYLTVEKAGKELMAKSITLEVGEHYWDTVEGGGGETVPLYYKRPRKYGVVQVEPPPPEIPDEVPWYQEWWVWAAVGGVVAGTVAIVVIANNVGGSDRLPQGDFPPVKLYE